MRNSGKLNKKGMDPNVLYMSVLAMVIIVLIAMMIFKFFDTAKEKLEIQDCKNSIGAHALLAKTSQREIFTDIKCQTREYNIDAKNHESARREIAEDMRRCWYEWQKGDAQLFEGEGTFCHVCAIYNFKQKDQKIDKFQTFLMRENIEIKKSIYPEDTEEMPYIQYMGPYKTEQLDEIEKFPIRTEVIDNQIIDTSKKYTTLFVYISGKDETEEALEGGGRTGYATRGGFYLATGTLVATAGAKGVLSATLTGAAVSGPVGWIVGGVILAGLGIYILTDALTPEQPQWMAYVVFREYTPEEIKEMGCQYLDVNQLSHQQP